MTNHKAWAKAIAQPAKEFPHTPVTISKAGTLYQGNSDSGK